MKIFLPLIFIISASCLSPDNKVKNNQPPVLDFLDTENIIMNLGEVYPVAYKKADSIYIVLNVLPKSINQILCEISFINKSDSDIILYRPILPDSIIRQHDFLIYDLSNKQVSFIPADTITGAKYYVGLSTAWPVIKPNLDSSNLIVLKPFSKMNFTVNLSRYYDFRSFFKKGINEFELSYTVRMPVIINNKHVLGNDGMSSKPYPLYYAISNLQDNTRGKSVRFLVPNG